MSSVKDIIYNSGGVAAIAKKLDISSTSISKWIAKNTIPADRLLMIEKITGYPRHEINPELFKGYITESSLLNQVVMTQSDVLYVFADELIKLHNSGSISNIETEKGLDCLKVVSETLDLSEFLTSTLVLWSSMIKNGIKVNSIDYDLVSKRGTIDPVVIKKTFTPNKVDL